MAQLEACLPPLVLVETGMCNAASSVGITELRNQLELYVNVNHAQL